MKKNFFRAKRNPAAWGLLLPLLLLAGCVTSPVQHDSVPYVRSPRKTIVDNVIEYRINPGDTIYSIAKRFGVEWQDVVIANPGLKTRDLRVGQTILIPISSIMAEKDKKPLPPQKPALKPAAIIAQEQPLTPKATGYKDPLSAETQFVWPARGQILAAYGKPVPWQESETNRGIDIAGNPGQAVLAAKSGRVNAFTDLPGYGRTVLLEHTDGTTTLYGNLAEILVPHWQWVKQGEPLGAMGYSEYSKQPALHFRVMRGERFLNPLSVLPQ